MFSHCGKQKVSAKQIIQYIKSTTNSAPVYIVH